MDINNARRDAINETMIVSCSTDDKNAVWKGQAHYCQIVMFLHLSTDKHRSRTKKILTDKNWKDEIAFPTMKYHYFWGAWNIHYLVPGNKYLKIVLVV
jgi:hypothetical protein